MKRPFFWIVLLISLPLITACVSPELPSEEGDPLSFQENIPKTNPRPRIPALKDLKASVLESNPEDETKKLIEKIEKTIQEPNILYEDIERGWYYGEVNEKKLGTPSTWIWVKDGKRSRWVSPSAMEETVQIEVEELCKRTAGTYHISCLETEVEGCEYIPANTCACIEGSAWHQEQGCLLRDEEGPFVEITPEELRRGWYQGLPNQKKLSTPPQWVWVDAGEQSRWQNPNPLQ